jgi:hypothetical protein
MCLKNKKLFRITAGKLPHVTVSPAFNRPGHDSPLFVVLPRLASARARFAVYQRSGLYITESPSGWVSGAVFYSASSRNSSANGWNGAARRRDGREREPCCVWTRLELGEMATPC